jgi:hypothetical protein
MVVYKLFTVSGNSFEEGIALNDFKAGHTSNQ